MGKPLFECWDADRLEPNEEHKGIIAKFKQDIRGLGVEVKPDPY